MNRRQLLAGASAAAAVATVSPVALAAAAPRAVETTGRQMFWHVIGTTVDASGRIVECEEMIPIDFHSEGSAKTGIRWRHISRVVTVMDEVAE